LHDPPLVYLDEPTKGLDPIIARRIRAFLMQLVKNEGKSLLLTSHIMAEVDEMASRVALIHRGSIPVTGSPELLKQAVGAKEFVEVQKNVPLNVIEELKGLPDVNAYMEREAGWLSFGVDDALVGAEAIIQVLRARGIKTHIRNHGVTLEDAFLYHIGELGEKFDD
jgi:ABC-2 type transport system ATP-binding protein